MSQEQTINTWLISNGGGIASDNCGSVFWTNDYVVGSAYNACGNTGLTTVTFVVSDDCENSTTIAASIEITDTTPPAIITVPVDVTVECDANLSMVELQDWLAINGGAEAAEACGSVTWSNDFVGFDFACGASGSTTVNFVAEDDCGNFATATATFMVTDNSAPDFEILPNNLQLECNQANQQALINNWLSSNGGGLAFDGCSAVTWSNDYLVGSENTECGATGSVLVTFTVTDECGSIATSSALLEVLDTTPPSIDFPAVNEIVECDGSGNAAELNAWLDNFGGAFASDECSTIFWTNDFVGLSDDCGFTGGTEVIFTASDECGNTSTTAATFLIEDTTIPSIDIAASDLSLECDAASQDAIINAYLSNNGNAIATDVCGQVVWTNDYIPGSIDNLCGASGVIVVTFTATDECANTTTTYAQITIEDNIPPTITSAAQDLTAECDGNGNFTALNTWLSSNAGAVAADQCGSVVWSNDFISLSVDCGENGSSTVTFTATDDCGNTSTTQATFTIEDSTAPAITSDAVDIFADCDDPNNQLLIDAWIANNGGATASDICSNPITWTNTYVQGSQNNNCGNTGPIPVVFTAMDQCGNSVSVLAEINMMPSQVLTIDPALDLNVECDGAGNGTDLDDWLSSNGGAFATTGINCQPIIWSNDYVALSDDCGATGQALVTFTATDACGDSATTQALITISDNVPPVLFTEATNLFLECSPNNDIEIINWLNSNGGAIASDVCSSTFWTNDFFAGSQNNGCGSTGFVVVNFSAYDECENETTTSAIINILDSTPPELIASSSDLIVECDGAGNTVELNNWLLNNGGAVAEDDCTSLFWNNDFTSLSNECGNTGSATVIFTVTDECGNTATTVSSFIIEDTTGPDILNESFSFDIFCNDGSQSAEINNWLSDNGGAFAIDNCSSNLTWSNDYTLGSLGTECGLGGSTVVTFLVSDACGNTSSTFAEIVVPDYNPVQLIQPASDSYVECDVNLNLIQIQAWLDNNGGAVALSDCGEVTWANDYSGLIEECGGTGITTVNFVAIDNCSNVVITSASFFVEDYTPPTINISAVDLSVDCLSGNNDLVINDWLAIYGGAQASDFCGDIFWSHDYIPGSAGISCGLTPVNFTVEDDCGNQSVSTAYINTTDGVAPVLTQQASDYYLECDGVGNDAEIQTWLLINGGASAIDDCSGITWTHDYISITQACGSAGTAIVTFTVTDDCGNTSTSSAMLIIEDSNRPTLGIPASDLTIDCNPVINSFTINGWLASNGGATASDICGSVTWSHDYVPVNYNCGQTTSTIVNFVATDECGLSKTTTATLTVNSSCVPNLFLTGTNSGDQSDINNNPQNDASTLINSDQYISPNADIIYNAGEIIELDAGFEVPVGASFEAYIEGCNNFKKE